MLAEAPKLKSLEVLRRLREQGYGGGKSAVYELVKQLRQQAVRAICRFEGVAGEFSQHDFGQVRIDFTCGGRSQVQFFASRLKYSAVRMGYADPETQGTGLSRVCQIGRVLIALHRSRCRLSIALAVYRSRRTSKAKPNMGMISQLARQLRTTEGWWPARFRSNSSSRSAGSSTLPAR